MSRLFFRCQRGNDRRGPREADDKAGAAVKRRSPEGPADPVALQPDVLDSGSAAYRIAALGIPHVGRHGGMWDRSARRHTPPCGIEQSLPSVTLIASFRRHGRTEANPPVDLLCFRTMEPDLPQKECH